MAEVNVEGFDIRAVIDPDITPEERAGMEVGRINARPDDMLAVDFDEFARLAVEHPGRLDGPEVGLLSLIVFGLDRIEPIFPDRGVVGLEPIPDVLVPAVLKVSHSASP